MQPQQLSYVVAVAEHRHFTRAAEALEVAQPSLSASIRALETELGAPLFHRARGNVTLTSAGEALLPIAKRILADIEAARQEVSSLVRLRGGRVRLGAPPSLCTGLLPGVLADFRRDYPGVTLQLREGGSRDLVRALDGGDLDLALVILPLSPREQGLVTQPLLREELVLATATETFGPPSAGPVPMAALDGVPLLTFRRGYDLRTALEAACRSAGVQPWLVVEGGELDAMVALAEAGVGACLLPTSVAQRARLVSYRLDAEQMTRTVGLARRKGHATAGAVRALRQTLDDHLRDDPQPGGIEVVGSALDPADVSVARGRD